MSIFITGATGFLGQEILFELLSANKSDKFSLLIRDKGKTSASDRCLEIVDSLSKVYNLNKNEIASRIECLPGDLSKPLMGLENSDFENLAASTDKIFHSGASVSFSQSLSEARNINVTGTENIIKLAKKIVARKDTSDLGAVLNYVSTAYVAGDQECVVSAKDLLTNRSFKNNYEKTKAEAEALVRKNWNEIPTHIYRPSMIVGNSSTGYSSSFTTIYVLGNLFIREIFKTFPGNPNVNFDIVPVDYVAKSIAKISSEAPGSEPCYHICAGVNREITLGEVILLCSSFIEKQGFKKLNLPTMIKPSKDLMTKAKEIILTNSFDKIDQIIENFTVKRPKIIAGITPYLLYTNKNPHFEMQETFDKFPQLVKPAPCFPDYHEAITDFWINNDRSLTRYLNTRVA